MLWKIYSPNKLKFFIWKLIHNRLPTNEYLQRLGIDLDPKCPICSSPTEYSNSIFFYRASARKIGMDLLDKANQKNRPKLNLSAFMPVNQKNTQELIKNKRYNKLVLWSEIIPYCLWTIWKLRNENVFQHTTKIAFFNHAYSQTIEYAHLSSEGHTNIPITPINIKWEPPKCDTFKLNIDGSFLGNPRKGGI